jgi:hypothetical protein
MAPVFFLLPGPNFLTLVMGGYLMGDMIFVIKALHLIKIIQGC